MAKFSRHYVVRGKIGDIIELEKFRSKTLKIQQIYTISDTDKAYISNLNQTYTIKDVVLLIPKERLLSKVEIPLNVKITELDWNVHERLLVKITTTDGDVADNSIKEITLIVVGELYDEKDN